MIFRRRKVRIEMQLTTVRAELPMPGAAVELPPVMSAEDYERAANGVPISYADLVGRMLPGAGKQIVVNPDHCSKPGDMPVMTKPFSLPSALSRLLRAYWIVLLIPGVICSAQQVSADHPASEYVPAVSPR